ncbi:uncharacterized protein LOC141704925 isoform X2 [Apium graveolens]|uniref:uncharacterized protein LOC141704925 isoform X2 n=1 Tax=Apium graveolens TaxID=4045 RepID=UPI003D7BE0B7
MPAKHKCIWCGKLLFYEHKISIHLKYFGGLNAIRTNKQSKQKKGKNPELNRSEKGKGVESVDEGKEESSKKGKHYNKDKTFGAGSSTNKSEGVEYGSCNGKSTLHSVKWDRIILEEQEASIGMTFVRMGFFTTNCMFDKFLNRLLVIPLSTLAGLSRSVIDYLFCQEPHSKLPDFLVFIIRGCIIRKPAGQTSSLGSTARMVWHPLVEHSSFRSFVHSKIQVRHVIMGNT